MFCFRNVDNIFNLAKFYLFFLLSKRNIQEKFNDEIRICKNNFDWRNSFFFINWGSSLQINFFFPRRLCLEYRQVWYSDNIDKVLQSGAELSRTHFYLLTAVENLKSSGKVAILALNTLVRDGIVKVVNIFGPKLSIFL